MKKRAIGAGAVVLLALGIWLGNLFQGFGTGEGETDSDGSNSLVSLTTDGSQPSTTSPGDGDNPASETPDVLTLLVDDDKYLIQWGEDWHADFAPATLEEIVTAAREAPGDENGVRVRLRVTEDAQNGAIDDLESALTDAGLKSVAIFRVDGYVEDVE